MARSLLELSPPGAWVGRRLDLYRETDSTNTVADQLARCGAPDGTLVIADAQRAGRGRLGRSFFSPGGASLYLSLLLRPQLAPQAVHRHVFVAARAVADCVAARLPGGTPVEIKWPNDVLIGGRKTAGINLPVRIDGDRVLSLILGIGLNINVREGDFPAELRPIATSLRIAAGHSFDRVELAEDLLARLEAGIDGLRSGGFPEALEGWKKYFRMRGKRVRVGGPGVQKEIEGVVEDVDPEGALLLRDGRTVRRILAGDVTLLAREE